MTNEPDRDETRILRRGVLSQDAPVTEAGGAHAGPLADEEARPGRRAAEDVGEAPGVPAASTTAARDDAPPRLLDGLELLGRYEDSGMREAPFLVRRPDGQMIQLPPLLYAVAERIDGQRTPTDIAADLREAIEREIDPEDVAYLIEEKLGPLGILDDGEHTDAEPVAGADPLLGLKMKTAVVPPRLVRGLAATFKPLFFPMLIVAILAGLVAFDTWLFFTHGVAQSVRQLVYEPLLMFMIFGLVAVAAAFHEIGHAAGCRYGGAEPGSMGAGIYIVWPAFYTDVSDSHRLGRGGRLRTDLGGVYFNTIFILATAGVYFATRFEPLLVLIVVQHLEIVRQLLPFLRLDGYYIVSDITGVPDLFSRIRPILASFIPWRKTDPRVKELKRWVRFAVTGWVLLVVPLLAFQLAMIAIHAPRILGTAWDSLTKLYGAVTSGFADGRPGEATWSLVRMLTLVLPLAGITYTMTRVGRKVTTATLRKTDGRPVARGTAFLGFAGVLAMLALAWWPDGDYRPIRPGERWTLPETVQAVGHTATGRQALEATTPSADSASDSATTPSTTAVTATPEAETTGVLPSPEPSPEPTPTASPTEAVPTPTPTP